MTARVLVVDDLLPNVKLLEAKLRSEFYEVTTAQSGMGALNSIKEFPPDIILLDVMMPEMDGFETCRRIKGNPDTADIPVVMVTALSDVEDRVQGLNAGADDFLTKPINDLALFARIRSLVRLKSMTDELHLRDKTGVQFGISEEINAKINDTAGSKILIIDEDAAESGQISSKLKELNISVDIMPDPAQAVRMSEKEDYDLIMVSTQLTTDDGLHLCTHFRSQEQTRNTPLLIIIEDNNTDTLVKGLDMGINDYLVTPIDSNEVVARARIQIRRKRYQDALKASHQQSLSMAITDGLTGLYNRQYFDMHMDIMIKNHNETRKPLSLMILDIDFFKKVNDTFGHISGDEILKQYSSIMLKSVRPTDFVARYGGEEFVIVMPDTTINQAAEVAERVRKTVENNTFRIPAGDGTHRCTISVGVSVAIPTDTPKILIERADKALYHVKNSGRNRVAVYCEPAN